MLLIYDIKAPTSRKIRARSVGRPIRVIPTRLFVSSPPLARPYRAPGKNMPGKGFRFLHHQQILISAHHRDVPPYPWTFWHAAQAHVSGIACATPLLELRTMAEQAKEYAELVIHRTVAADGAAQPNGRHR